MSEAETKRAGFYRRALEVAQQLELDAAADVEGLSEEIALLRMELQQMAVEDDNSNSVKGGRVTLFRGLETLAKLVATQDRIGRKPGENLALSVRGLLRELDELVEEAGG